MICSWRPHSVFGNVCHSFHVEGDIEMLAPRDNQEGEGVEKRKRCLTIPQNVMLDALRTRLSGGGPTEDAATDKNPFNSALYRSGQGIARPKDRYLSG